MIPGTSEGVVERAVAGVRVRATSWAGVATSIELPDLGVLFDLGACPPNAIRYSRVFLTHGHVDHVGAIAHHVATRALRGLTPPEYVIPEDHVDALEGVLAAFRRLDRSDLPATVRAARPHEGIPIGGGRRVVPFRAVHRVPTLGYAVVGTRRRLRTDLAGLSPDDLVALRRSGEGVDETYEVVEAAFCGDTTAGVLDLEPMLARARLLVLEATFLDDRVSARRARETGHVHLDDLLERVHLLTQEGILLTHASARYTPAEIEEILDRRLPAELRSRVVALGGRA